MRESKYERESLSVSDFHMRVNTREREHERDSRGKRIAHRERESLTHMRERFVDTRGE